MKKFFFVFLLLVVSSTIPILLVMAETTPPPQVDEPISPIDSNKGVITGHADPYAKIIVTGGLYDIPPSEADENGDFSVTVALIQESGNTYFIQAENEDATPSDPIEITIIEGVAEVAEYEAETGEDRTAPDAPELNETEVETEDSAYTIVGSGEAGADVLVNNEESGEKVDSNGNFSVEVAISGGGDEEVFNIAVKDEAGNLSSNVKIYITGQGEEVEDEEDQESDNDEDEDETEEKDELTDINGHWAEDYILELYNNDVIGGYGDGRFGPNDSITRAQIVKISLLAFELPTADGDENFTDVKSGDWFVDYVASASGDLGIVSGYSDNTFKPNNNVTRAEALKIILVAAGVNDFDSVTPNFTDVDTVNDWFSKYTAYAKSSGLVGGYSDGTFRGNQTITRAEVCKIVVELIDSLTSFN